MKYIVGIILFSLFVFFSAYLHDNVLGKRIEKDLEAKTKKIFEEEGIDISEVNVSGHHLDRNLVVSLSKDTLDELDGIIGMYLPDERSLDNGLVDKVPIITVQYTDVDFRAERRGGTIYAAGVLPDVDYQARLLTLLEENANGAEVVDQTSIAENPDLEFWWDGRASEVVSDFFSGSEGNGYVHFMADDFETSGEFNDEAAYQNVQRFVSGIPFEIVQNADLVYNEPVPEPINSAIAPLPDLMPTPSPEVLEPVVRRASEIFMVEDENENIVISGTVSSEKSKSELMQAVKNAIPANRNIILTDEVKVMENVAPFASLVDMKSLLASHIKKAQRAELDYSAEGLTLRGALSSENAKQEIIALAKPATVNEAIVLKDLLTVEGPSPEELAEQLVDALKPLPVYFDTSSSVIKVDQEVKITKAAMIILESNAQNVSLTVGGYADKRGNADFNKRLSLKRANAVKSRLIELGVAADGLAVNHFGEDTSNMAKADLWKARRVAITLTKINE